MRFYVGYFVTVKNKNLMLLCLLANFSITRKRQLTLAIIFCCLHNDRVVVLLILGSLISNVFR